jgi:hypothetical protein
MAESVGPLTVYLEWIEERSPGRPGAIPINRRVTSLAISRTPPVGDRYWIRIHDRPHPNSRGDGS